MEIVIKNLSINKDLREHFLKTEKFKHKIVAASFLKRIFLYPKYFFISLMLFILKFFNLSIKICCKTFWGQKYNLILPEAVSSEIFRFKYIDESVTNYIINCVKKSDIVVDIGAHYGFFSLLMNKIVGLNGQVYSFEPSKKTFNILKLNSKDTQINAYNLGVWKSNTKLFINDNGIENSAFNSFKEETRNQNRHNKSINTYEIEVISLDTFFKKNNIIPNFIKIDAESSEDEVIIGMQNILKNYKPTLCVELGDMNVVNTVNSKTIIKKLIKLNYVPIEWISGELSIHNIRETYSYCNLLFIDKSKIKLYDIRKSNV